MKVFVIGATGYIGFQVAQAFRRAGHEVWGLTRSTGKARVLAEQEIHTVVGSMQKPESYRAAAETCDVLVQVAVDYAADTAAVDRLTVETLLAACHHDPQPKTFVYTSGAWIYGDTGGEAVTETAPLAPFRGSAFRLETEPMVLSAPGGRGIVLRPGDVYGKSGGLTGNWFGPASQGNAPRLPGEGHNHWPLVHVDGLAAAYVLAAESGHGGEVFNIADKSRFTLRQMATAAACAAGYDGEPEFLPLPQALKEMGPIAEALAYDQLMDSSKAEHLLGWHAERSDFVDNAAPYFAAWQAWQIEARG